MFCIFGYQEKRPLASFSSLRSYVLAKGIVVRLIHPGTLPAMPAVPPNKDVERTYGRD